MKSVTFLRKTWRKKDKDTTLPPTPPRDVFPAQYQPSSKLEKLGLPPPPSPPSSYHGPNPNAQSVNISRSPASPTPSQRSTPPRRPPRPPSLNLFLPEKYDRALPAPPSAVPTTRPLEPTSTDIAYTPSPPMSQSVSVSSRSSSELDGVWNEFLTDLQSPATPPRDRKSVHNTSKSPTVDAVLDSSLYSLRTRHQVTGSTPHLPYTHARAGSPPSRPPPPSPSPSLSVVAPRAEDKETDFSLSLFPAPPPLRIRKKTPKALVLLPSPAIVPLPPSPASFSFSTASSDTTPLATPVTPSYSTAPHNILRSKSSNLALAYNFAPGVEFSSPSKPSSPYSSHTYHAPRRGAQPIDPQDSYFSYNHHRTVVSEAHQRSTKIHTKFLSALEISHRHNSSSLQDADSPIKGDIEWGYAV